MAVVSYGMMEILFFWVHVDIYKEHSMMILLMITFFAKQDRKLSVAIHLKQAEIRMILGKDT